jgi:hypothetical protein
MLDPGALGTLVIGLEKVRLDQEWSEPAASPVDTPSRRRRLAQTTAGWLRGLADVLEPGSRQAGLESRTGS